MHKYKNCETYEKIKNNRDYWIPSTKVSIKIFLPLKFLHDSDFTLILISLLLFLLPLLHAVYSFCEALSGINL